MDHDEFKNNQKFRRKIVDAKQSGMFKFPDGSVEFYRDGKRHREDGPAVLTADGGLLWYCEDRLHRDDGPAVQDADGDLGWYHHGKLHRPDGPPLVMNKGARTQWF